MSLPMFFPRDEVFRAKRNFFDFGIGRSGGVTAEINFIDAKDIGGAEKRADIEERANILDD